MDRGIKGCVIIGWAMILVALVFFSPVYAEVDIPDKQVDEEIVVMNKENNVEVQTPPTATETPKINRGEKSGVGSPVVAPNITKPIDRKAGVLDKIISSTFKSLAKGFVTVVDINQIKKNNVAKIDKMSPEKFRKQYSKAYVVLKDMPDKLKAEYKIAEDISKEQVIKDIESLNKSKMYRIIDSIPDTVIADNFKRYLEQSKQEIQAGNVVGQIHKLWNKWMEKWR